MQTKEQTPPKSIMDTFYTAEDKFAKGIYLTALPMYMEVHKALLKLVQDGSESVEDLSDPTEIARLQFPTEVAITASQIGKALDNTGKQDEAAIFFAEAQFIYETVEGQFHPDVAEMAYLQGGICKKQQEFPAASSYFKQGLSILQTCIQSLKKQCPYPDAPVRMPNEVAALLDKCDRIESEISALNERQDLSVEAQEEQKSKLLSQAEANFSQALKNIPADFPVVDRMRLTEDLHNKLGTVMEAQKRYQEALSEYQNAQATFDQLNQFFQSDMQGKQEYGEVFDCVKLHEMEFLCTLTGNFADVNARLKNWKLAAEEYESGMNTAHELLDIQTERYEKEPHVIPRG